MVKSQGSPAGPDCFAASLTNVRHSVTYCAQDCVDKAKAALSSSLLAAATAAAAAHDGIEIVEPAADAAAAAAAAEGGGSDGGGGGSDPAGLEAAAEALAAGAAGQQRQAAAAGQRVAVAFEDRALTRKEEASLLHPLLRLRQACCHPQVGWLERRCPAAAASLPCACLRPFGGKHACL